jgi:hypothetical protein
MYELNLNEPIIPGVSAAGFKIGSHLTDMQNILDVALVVDLCEPINFNKKLAQSQGWIFAKERDCSSLYYKNRFVRLDFSSRGILYAIYVFNGYEGSLFDKLSIGSYLLEITEFFEVNYDDGDEMHYPIKSSAICGISFCAAELPLYEDTNQQIIGFCVHNWMLDNN